jgi:hypothetical protein
MEKLDTELLRAYAVQVTRLREAVARLNAWAPVGPGTAQHILDELTFVNQVADALRGLLGQPDVCLAGNPAVDGKCGQTGCVCGSTLPFAQLHNNVMRGSDRVAVATSRTMAKRIARALNSHTPNSRGV